MNDKNENTITSRNSSRKEKGRIIIRVGCGKLSFLQPYEDGTIDYAPYVVKSGISMSANLRQAFKEAPLLMDHENAALLSVCSPVALIPLDEYMDDESFDASVVYSQTFTGHEHDAKLANVLPELNAVAVFGVNKDLKMVIEDNFRDVRIQNVMQPVWSYLYNRSSLVGRRRKLYGYFHDDQLDIFGFQQRRFRFSNVFDATHAHDALYYLLYVWKQLGFDNNEDELHVVGNTEHKTWLLTKLKTFLRRVYVMNPTAELNRAPASLIDGIDFDLML